MRKTVNEEGERQSQNCEKEVEPKQPKRNRKKMQLAATEFPTTIRINEYGFLYFKEHWLGELGWVKGMELKMDRAPDGSLTLSKA